MRRHPSKTLFRAAAIGAALAATALLAGAPAQAAVTYTFSEVPADPTNPDAFGTGGFTFTTATFITHDRTITPDTCTIDGDRHCTTMDFDVSPNTFGGADDFISFGTENNDLSGSGGAFFFFQVGAFSAPGTYSSLGYPMATPGFGNAGVATLIVSGVADASAAPEPAAWMLAILGFGGTGAMMRRRNLAMI